MHFSDCQTSNKIFLFHNETEADWQVFPVRSALRSDTGGGHLLVPAHCQTISVNISNIHIYIFLIRNSWYNIMQYMGGDIFRSISLNSWLLSVLPLCPLHRPALSWRHLCVCLHCVVGWKLTFLTPNDFQYLGIKMRCLMLVLVYFW